MAAQSFAALKNAPSCWQIAFVFRQQDLPS
jgi:hypothetical protein